ncbi:MAG: rhodanese-like domain-containing protein [Elusimicrobiota bacterium]
MSVDEAAVLKKANKAVFIDVRTEEEYKRERIEGSLFIPYQQVNEKKDVLPKNKNSIIVVYCTVGVRSGWAQRKIEKLGYSQVFNMKGGIEMWKKENLPVLKESKENN